MKKTLLFLAAMMVAFASCTNNTPAPEPDPIEEEPKEPEEPQEPEEPEEPEDEWAWENGYPKGVSVSEFTEEFADGKKCLGFIATIDFNANPNLCFSCLHSSPKKKPSEIFASFSQSNNVPCLATNAGYFAGNTSVSMLVHLGSVKVRAYKSFNWPNDENAQCSIYPVRSAIGQMSDGSFQIQWAYCTNIPMATHTAFPSALDNNEQTKTFMSEPPTEDYCEGTFKWEPREAVGGGPRIVKDGKNVAVENYWAECLDAGGTSGLMRVNRTAAGYTADGKLVLLVADGRGSRGSVGYTLSEMAEKLISLGCINALNLDGGGSSCMVGAEGQVLNAPSDANGERAVSTAIVISEKPHRS